MIKAIFFDVDGTLIAHGEETISNRVKEALRQLQKQGIKLFVATGRPPNSIDHVSSAFKFDGYLTANGQYCFNEIELLHEKYIPRESLKMLIPYIEEHKIPVLFSTLKMNYRNACNTTFHGDSPLVNYEKLLNKDVIQLMVPIQPEQDAEFLAHLPLCKTARWTDAFTDVIPEDGGKDCGIKKMIEYYNISLDEVMACGDGENDLTMLDYVPHSVAMGNANDIVKSHASFVTTHINEDGLINAFKHFNILDENF